MIPDRLASFVHSGPQSRWLESYPAHLCRTWTLPSGRSLRVRPIRHDDDGLEAEFVRGLSCESAYQRMLSAIKVTPEWVRSMTHIDYQRHMALVAATTLDGVEQFVGVGRYVVDRAGRSAEVAIVITDAWQGQGLGRRLLGALLEHAREAKVHEAEGIVLATNTAMLGLARALGFTLVAEPGDATVVRIARVLTTASAQTH